MAELATNRSEKINIKNHKRLISFGNDTTARTAARDLEYLVENDILKMKGERKGSFYELTNGGYGG